MVTRIRLLPLLQAIPSVDLSQRYAVHREQTHG
jgi:hypothetical protein